MSIAASAPVRISDRQYLLFGVLILSGCFAFGASVQALLVHGLHSIEFQGVLLHPLAQVAVRFTTSLVTMLMLGFGSVLLRLHERSVSIALLLALALVIVTAVVRLLLQTFFGIHPWNPITQALSDALIAVPIGLLTIMLPLLLVSLRRRVRAAEIARQAAAIRAAEALAELQQEELRVRRNVADALHGTLQQRFLLFEASLASAAATAAAWAERAPSPDEAAGLSARLEAIGSELDELREHELRELSAALYPEALDRGLVPACRALVRRIPHIIAVGFDASNLATPDSLDRAQRLLLVRAVEEGVSNALRHGRATEIDVSLAQDDGVCSVSVRHRGASPVEHPALSGLERLRNRLSDHRGGLELTAESGGGELRAWVPLAA